MVRMDKHKETKMQVVLCCLSVAELHSSAAWLKRRRRQKPHGGVERTVAPINVIAPCSTLRALGCSSLLRKVV